MDISSSSRSYTVEGNSEIVTMKRNKIRIAIQYLIYEGYCGAAIVLRSRDIDYCDLCLFISI